MSPAVNTRSRLPYRADGRITPERAPFEFYPTPPEATRAFLNHEEFDDVVWEPACGEGAISMELDRYGIEVVSTDLVDYGFGTAGVDFLDCTEPRGTHIVTNPPYGRGLADRFIRHALSLTESTGGKVAMLLNLVSLCHPDRHASFIARPPARVYALDDCVCYPNGNAQAATRYTHQHRYCWMVWEPPPLKVPTTLHWLSTAPYREGGAS